MLFNEPYISLFIEFEKNFIITSTEFIQYKFIRCKFHAEFDYTKIELGKK
jgi:hypothetical protein